jgi:hypothetical protein
MKSFLEFLLEGNKKYYPYKLARWKKGQKKRSISTSNAYYIGQKALKKKVAAAHRVTKPKYRKKTTKR